MMMAYCEMCDEFARAVTVRPDAITSISLCYPCMKEHYPEGKEKEMQQYKYKIVREVNGNTVGSTEATVDKPMLATILGNLMLEYGVPSEAIPLSDGGSAVEFFRETRKGYICALVTYFLVGAEEPPIPDSEGICYLAEQGVLSKIS